MSKLYKISLLILFVQLGSTLLAQEDTLRVKLIEFSDGIDNRRAWRAFPSNNGKTYRQVLMHRSYKCAPDLIFNKTGSGCGEWDYGDHVYFYHHRNADSLLYLAAPLPSDTILVYNDTTYSHYRKYLHFLKSTSQGDTNYTIGTGNLASNKVLQTKFNSSRSLFIYRANELTASGMQAGLINKLTLDVSALGSKMPELKIKMAHTTKDSLLVSDLASAKMKTVYHYIPDIASTGAYTFDLTRPFNWDGVSNLLVEFSFSNNASGDEYEFMAHNTAYPSNIHSTQDDQVIYLNGNSYVDLPLDIHNDLNNELTFSFWMKGDPIPENTTVARRFLNCSEQRPSNAVSLYQLHLPNNSANGNMNFKAGNSGSFAKGYKSDAFSFTADSIGMYANHWNHWAFTKNATTGLMRIYFNGQLIHSTSNNTIPLSAAGVRDKMRLGNWSEWYLKRVANNPNASNQPYKGAINDFQIWNKALDSAELHEIMYNNVSSSNTLYNNLIVYYPFENPDVTAVDDKSSSGYHGDPFGYPSKYYLSGEELNRNMAIENQRPNMVFNQGIYTSSLDSTLVTYSKPNQRVSIKKYKLVRNVAKGGYDRVFVGSDVAWRAGYSYTYDEKGNKIDSTFYAFNKTYINHYREDEIYVRKYITPYGNNLDLGEGFKWTWDVTDFQNILRDSIDLVGGTLWGLVDLEFEFIEGTPPRDVLGFHHLEDFRTSYEDIVAKPKNLERFIYPDVNGKSFVIEGSFTGGGFNNPTNCAEFCRRNHYLKVDGVEHANWVPWKKCSDNPLYPQGGTWLYDRTGWCPGAPQDLYRFDITNRVTPGKRHVVLKGVEADPTGTEYGTWGGFMNLFSFDDPNFQIDATAYEVITPSNKDVHGRKNPLCSDALVVIRNNAAVPLTSLTVTYRVKGGTTLTYDWTGNLTFMEMDTLSLPISNGSFYKGDGSNTFVVSVSNPNGKVDENPNNDSYTSYFDLPDMYEDRIIVDLKTNNYPLQNSYFVTNAAGQKIFERTNLSPNTRYRDEIKTWGGCNTLHVHDSGNDGLEYWANTQQGNGFIYIRRASNNQLLKQLDPDFGSGIQYSFAIGDMTYIREPNIEKMFSAYPNPVQNKLNIDFTAATKDSRLILFNAVGKAVYTQELSEEVTSMSLDVQHLSAGVYTLNWVQDGDTFSRRVILEN